MVIRIFLGYIVIILTPALKFFRTRIDKIPSNKSALPALHNQKEHYKVRSPDPTVSFSCYLREQPPFHYTPGSNIPGNRDLL
jgi:hypothetical protein